MAHWKQKLMNWNKHKRKKLTSEDVNTTTRLQKHNNNLSYCNLTNVSVEYLFRCCFFSHHTKSTPLFIYYGFQYIKISWKLRKKTQKSLEIKDLASPWCNAGEETSRWLFFLASLRWLQKVQKWAVSLPRTPNYRRASDGVVFTAERSKYFMSNAKWEEFCWVEWDRLSMRGKQRVWLVVRNTLLSWQF